MDDIFAVRVIGKNFLTCVNGEEPTESQITTFVEVAKRGNMELLVEGDIVLPLKSPTLKNLAASNSIFYRFITDPTQENLKLLESALSASDVLITQVWMNNDVLRLSVDRMKIMEKTLKKVALAGLKYGASKLLKKAEVVMTHKPTKEQENDIDNLRGNQLSKYMLNMITFSGGEVKLQKRKRENKSKSNPQAHEEMRLSKEFFSLNPKLRSEKGMDKKSKKRIDEKSEKVVDEKPEKGGVEKLEKGVVQKSPSPISDQFRVINYPPETCKPFCTWTLSPSGIQEGTMKQQRKKVNRSHLQKQQGPSGMESGAEGLLKNLEIFSELNKKQKKEVRKKCRAFLSEGDSQAVASSETMIPTFPLRSLYLKKKDSIDKVEFENAELPSGAPYPSQPLWTWRGKQFVDEIFSSNEELELEENSFSVPKVQPQDQEKELVDDFVFVRREELMQQKEDKGISKDLFTMRGESGTESNIHEDCLLLSIDDIEVGNEDKTSDDIVSGKLNEADEARTEMYYETTVQHSLKPEILITNSKKKLQKIVVNHDELEGESNAAVVKKGKSSPKYCSEYEDSPTIQLLVTEDSPDRENISRSIHYKPVVDLKSGKPWNGSGEDYCKILVEELKRAAAIKHGDVSSPEWRKFLEEQAWRCMTLQMLSVSHSNYVRIEVDGSTQNTKEWAFVLYNYARLSMIFELFEEYVARGDFQPLPLPDDVDFSLLSREEEWALVWIYILRWPEILEEMALSVLDESKKLKTAAVARFLHSLSHRFSEYYSRYHVLVSEPLSHLMPLMYARLYLLKAILTVMRICFNLLGVHSPPTFM